MRAFLSRTALLGLILFVAAAMTPKVAVDDVRVGTVTRVKPTAIAIQDAQPRVLAQGSPIFRNDIISTGLGARVQMRMIDDTVLTLSGRSQFVVQQYEFGAGKGNAAVRLLSGSLRAVSGRIAKLDVNAFKVVTDVATIGVRGTDFWIGPFHGVTHVELQDDSAIFVENRAGRVEIKRAGWGTFIKSADSAPTAPEFWPKWMNDRVKESMSFD
jgi:hypothetical protein